LFDDPTWCFWKTDATLEYGADRRVWCLFDDLTWCFSKTDAMLEWGTERCMCDDLTLSIGLGVSEGSIYFILVEWVACAIFLEMSF